MSFLFLVPFPCGSLPGTQCLALPACKTPSHVSRVSSSITLSRVSFPNSFLQANTVVYMLVHYCSLHLNQVLHLYCNFPKCIRQILVNFNPPVTTQYWKVCSLAKIHVVVLSLFPNIKILPRKNCSCTSIISEIIQLFL